MASARDKLVTNTADIGAGAALSVLVAATASPLALVLAGASLVSFITAWSVQGTNEAAAEEAEAQRRFEALVRESGSVRRALERIAEGQTETSLFIADKAREVLTFLAALRKDQATAMRDHEELAVYIGSKIESYFEELGVASRDRHRELAESTGRIEHLLHDLLGARTLHLGDLDRYEAVYREWLAKTTGKLLVPGLGVELSITDSSAKLRVMAPSKEKEPTPVTAAALASELRRYREWAVHDERHDSDAIDAIHLREYGEALVVVGGPGSGKSTLARQIAHTAAAANLVLLARLKDVAKLLPTVGFTDALAIAAFEHAGVPKDAWHQLLERAACIVLDGLDETGSRRSSVAEHIRAWRQGHQSCQMVVMTRPVGHDPALLPGWKHIELKKLTADEARSAAKRMVAAIAANDPYRIVTVDEALGEAMTSNPAVSLAARNPLLLGFVVHRLSEGGALPSRRVDLFDLVIKRLGSVPSDRDVPAADSLALRRSLEAIGWIVLSFPDATRDYIVEKLARQYGASALHDIDSISRAEKAIELWEERRVIETLSVGAERGISFVHPALGEYAAACHAARLSLAEFAAWITKSRLRPQWRETLLMSAAAGRCDDCARTLLSLDAVDDPAAIEATLAAAAVVENQGAHLETIAQVLERLALRLTSSSRLVCTEAADAIWSLFPFSEALIAPLVVGLQEHEQVWTRRMAFTLTAASNPQSTRIDLADEHLEWLISGRDHDAEVRWFNRDSGALRAKALETLVPLAAAGGRHKTIQAIVEAWSEGHMTIRESSSVRRLLTKIGALSEGTEPAFQRRIRERFGDLGLSYPWHADANAILETVISAAAKLRGDISETTVQVHPPMMNLARVIAGLKFWDLPAFEISNVDSSTPHAVAIFAAAIVATGSDPSLIEAEAKALLAAGDHMLSAITSEKVPQFPDTVDWSKAPDWVLSPELLVRAVTHESQILSWPAGNLIVDGISDVALRESIVREALEICESESAMRVLAAVLRELNPAVATELALTRLKRKFGPATPPLIAVFKTISVGSREVDVTQLLERALQADVANAVEASAVLAAVPALGVAATKMKEALGHWASAESPYPQGGGIVPPSPRANLVTAISRRNNWTLDELVTFTHDQRSDVGDAGITACIELARRSESSLKEMILYLLQGRISARVLDEIGQKEPALARPIIPDLEHLLRHGSRNVRLASLRLLTGLQELSTKASSYASKAMHDSDVAVRDEAIRVLRRISG